MAHSIQPTPSGAASGDRQKPPRSVVIGGGLLGTHVALRLAADGSPTTVFSRSFNPLLLANAGHLGIRLVEGEVEPSQQLREEIDAADVIFYMAGSSTPSGSDDDPAASLVASVAPAVTVLELVRRVGGRRLILASSGGTVYGSPTIIPTPEDAPLEPISVHGVNAVAMERYAQFFAERHGLDLVVLRYSNLYGPGQIVRQNQGVVAAWIQAILAGEPIVLFGDGSVRRDFVYADDAAEATLLVASHPAARGVFNVGTGQTFSLREMLDVVEDAVEEPFVVEVREDRGFDVPIIELDCSRIHSLTGWVPSTEPANGVAASLEWLRALDAGTVGSGVQLSAGASRSR